MKKYSFNRTNIFLSIFLIGVFIWISTQMNTYIVPNSDFLNYLNVGQRMLANPIDPVITSAPLYSVIVYMLEIVLPMSSPGVFGGISINIIFLILTLYFAWILSRRWLGAYALLPVVFFAINHVTLSVVLQPSNIPLALLFVFVAMYQYPIAPSTAYLLVILAMLTRIEAIVLFPLFFILDIFYFRKFRCPKIIIALFAVVVIWYIRPVVPRDNYVEEMVNRSAEIPNMAFLKNSFIRAPFSYNLLLFTKQFDSFPYESIVLMLVLTWLLFGAIYFYRRDQMSTLLMCGFVVGYTVIHFIFPDPVIRYSYPLLPFVYILLCWPIALLRNKRSIYQKVCIAVVMTVLSSLILFFSLINGPMFTNDQRWDRAERRFASEWLNANIHRKIVVYSFEYYVYQYYIKNPLVRVIDTTKLSTWSQDFCSQGTDIYVVFDNQTDGQGGYFDHLNGLGYFQALQKSKDLMSNLILVKSIRLDKRHADIYKFAHNSSRESCAITFHE